MKLTDPILRRDDLIALVAGVAAYFMTSIPFRLLRIFALPEATLLSTAAFLSVRLAVHFTCGFLVARLFRIDGWRSTLFATIPFIGATLFGVVLTILLFGSASGWLIQPLLVIGVFLAFHAGGRLGRPKSAPDLDHVEVIAPPKLYLQEGGQVVEYHQLWFHEGTLFEQWGAIGEAGSVKEHRVDVAEIADTIERLTRPAIERGFAPIKIEQHATLIVEYETDGSDEAIDKRYRLQDKLDEVLAWTGLGHCDGGSIGRGTMEACCFVVDFDRARLVIGDELMDCEFSDYSRIYRED